MTRPGRTLLICLVLLGSALESRSQAQAPRRFTCDTADNAARAAVAEAHRLSEEQQLRNRSPNPNEFGGWVYALPDGRFTFTDAIGGVPDRVEVGGQLSEETRIPPASGAYEPRLRGGERVVGSYHIHPAGGVLLPGQSVTERRRQYRNGRHSPDDIALARRYGVPAYLRTPDETVVYDPARDPNDGTDLPPLPDSTRRVPEPPEGACQEVPSALEAWLFGDPHLVSLDGVTFAFQGAGEFIATNAPDGLQVQVRLEPYAAKPSVSFVTAVAVRFAQRRIGIYASDARILVDAVEPAEVSDRQRDGSVTLSDGIVVSRRRELIEVASSRGDRLRVRVSRQDYLDVALLLDPERRGKVSGLLGDFDGSRTNELKTRRGALVDVQGSAGSERFNRLYRTWGDDWRVGAAESLFDYGPGRGAKDYDRREFPVATADRRDVDEGHPAERARCAKTGVRGVWLQACAFDLAVTGDDRFLGTYRDLAGEVGASGAEPQPLEALALDSAPRATTDRCSTAATCADCTARSGCGYCAEKKVCVPVSQRSTCGAGWNAWSGNKVSCVECGTRQGCAACLADLFCAWSPSVGCHNAAHRAPGERVWGSPGACRK